MGQTTIDLEAPADSPWGDFHFLGTSVLWRDVDRDLAITIEDPDGHTFALPTSPDFIYEPWFDGLFIYAERGNSSRGTAKVDVYVFEPDLGVPVPTGGWKLHVSDPSPPGSGDLEVIAYVQDDASGWGLGIHFPEHASEDHLIGHPGTADSGIAVAAYTGVGHNGGTPGTRAQYSGRGYRIDGAEILSISGPDDPVTSGYREGAEARYFIYGGTSAASPHVAGVAALLLQAAPTATGLDVRQALRDGALADEAVGMAPNHDYGYGKLRAFRSLYGTDPPVNAPPTIAPVTETIEPGAMRTVSLAISDPDDAVADLVVEVDRDYDGSYDEVVVAQTLEVSFDEPGARVMKLRARDPAGATGYALARIHVVAGPVDDPRSAGASDPDTILTGRACLCSAPGAPRGPRPFAWLALALLPLLRRARRSGREAVDRAPTASDAP